MYIYTYIHIYIHSIVHCQPVSLKSPLVLARQGVTAEEAIEFASFCAGLAASEDGSQEQTLDHKVPQVLPLRLPLNSLKLALNKRN